MEKIKEAHRRVMVANHPHKGGSMQVVEVEQAAMWKFLWWSGIITVHVMVGQNIDDHSLVDVLYAECLHLSLCEGRTHAGCCNNLTRYMLEHFDSDSVIRITGNFWGAKIIPSTT
ncbi:hypothetical protein C5167_014923 [Papaver somniferum]|uniref:Uncharacterized protein n=1 Tax=Papaver somniferum TaxID=3469 RepID=A0A4Y7J6J6_PAPSO|nr:hypothetical protein C5167_014923 [Papaver somniferum]